MYQTLRGSILQVLCALALLCLGFTSSHATEAVLHSMTNAYFPGANPIGQLTPYNGLLYGVCWYGLNSQGDVFSMTTSGTVKIIHEFGGGASDGDQPWSGLVQTGGNFYGVTIYGGASDVGVVYKMTPSGTITILHTFTGQNTSNPSLSDGAYPYARLLVGSDGNLYGTTEQGGVNNQGTVFKIGTSGGSTYSLLHSFLNTSDTAYNPFTGLAQAPSGVLYGTSYNASGFSGGLYKINTDGSGYTFVHGFNGSSDPLGYNPYCDLILANDGNLYGTCEYGGVNNFGTVFKVVPGSSDTLSLLYAFDGGTGAYPAPAYSNESQNRLIQGSDHNLYGVTQYGGANGYGTVFKLTLAGVCTLLTSFSVTDTNGSANPLAQSGSSYYLTSYYGGMTAVENGPQGYGAGMSISSSGSLKVIQNFYVNDANHSYGSLVQVGTGTSAAFYGVTQLGGEFGEGAIFKITSSGSFSIIHHLNNSYGFWEGVQPVGGLMLYSDGKTLYGTTTGGGKYGNGTIFKVTTSGTLTVIHHFAISSREGVYPTSALIEGVGSDKNIYGTCYEGGPSSSGAGCVFMINSSGSAFKVLHFFGFGSTEGAYPECTPVPDGAGNLYGTCYQGGANSLGIIWKLSTNGAAFTKLFDFYYDNTLGYYPAGYDPYYGGKLALVSGMLYGVTAWGGQYDDGVIFQCNTSTGATTALHPFQNGAGEGYNPYGGIVYDSTSGNFYGTCKAGGASGMGTVYKVAQSTGILTLLHSFTGYNSSNPPLSDGDNPYAGVTLGSDGFLYGTTFFGGDTDYGCVFQQTTTP